MNNERKIEKKVNCKICGEEIDNPFDTAIKAVNYLRMPVFHFTDKHVKELREFLGKKTLADILGTDEDSLYPIYMEAMPPRDAVFRFPCASVDLAYLLQC